MSVIAVIPARHGATRFPGKLLVDLHGRPLLEWVYRRARRLRGVDQVWVATDDDRIERAAAEFGAPVARTRSDHASGTDRIGEVVAGLDPRPDFILNLQGDEPLLPVAAVERMLVERARDPQAIWTLVAPLEDDAEWRRPSVVKAVVSRDGRALYFSRSPVPYDRAGASDPRSQGDRWRHVGIYGYPAPLLLRMVALPPSPLETREGLEQLRWLEAGAAIRIVEAKGGSPGIDTPEDLENLRRAYPDARALEAAE